MRKNLYLVLLLLFSAFASSAQQLAKKYDRASFTLVPIFSTITDTLACDTLYSSWSSLPHFSIFLSEVEHEMIQSDVITGQKFYYNHTTVPQNTSLVITKKDTVVFEHAFGGKILEKEFRSLPDSAKLKPEYKSVPSFKKVSDDYGDWLLTKLQASDIPGEMMMVWTNTDVLVKRSDGNKDIIDKQKNANQFSINYYKKLLEKNYIVVQHNVKTVKYKVNPEILKKEKAAKEAAKNAAKSSTKTKGLLGTLATMAKDSEVLKKEEDLVKGVKSHVDPYRARVQKFDSTRLVTDKEKFVRSYVYRIKLTDKLLAELSSYPPIFPKNVELEFVASTESIAIEATTSNADQAKRRNDKESVFDVIKNSFNSFAEEDTTYSDRYLAGKESAVKLLEKGEYPCAVSILGELRAYKNKEIFFLDSLLAICKKELANSPKINPIAFKYASNLEKRDSSNFFYQARCESFSRIDTVKNQPLIQGGFNEVVKRLERNIPEFQVLAMVEETDRNKLKVNIDLEQGIYLNQQYKIIERRENAKTGERYDERIGTARIVKIAKDLYDGGDVIVNQTVFAQIDGKKARENAILVQNETSGISLYTGYGIRYDDEAIIFGADFSLKSLLRYPIAKIGLGVVSNRTTQFVGRYKPLYFNLNASREFYFSRFFDFKPYLEAGYGGDFKNDEPVQRSFLVGGGLGLPINIYNRKSTQKFKLMPEVSFSTLGFKPQYSLQMKIEI